MVGDEFVSFRGVQVNDADHEYLHETEALFCELFKKRLPNVPYVFPRDLFANHAVFGTETGLKVPSRTEIV